jgi:uncharacterized protein DUF4332
VIVLGLAAFALSTAALALLIEPFPTWYYHCAWWSYIVTADGLNRRLGGRTLIRDRPAEFLRLAACSVLWWTLFEAINLRLGNWYYVMEDPSRAWRWTGGVLAFATVLPGIVETLELIENAGWLRSIRVQPLRWGGGKQATVIGMGAAFFVLPLVWPDVFFPLTWGSFVFLVEPWNRRHARRSFLRDLEAGDAGPFCRTLLAGLVCGVFWELWNYWARTRWIYTVPGFERFKLFEMPLTGFLGFPPFAVECVSIVRFLSALRGRLPRAPAARRAAEAALAVAGAALTLLIFVNVDPVTVDSSYRPLAELTVLPVEQRLRLAAIGLSSPEKLLRALATAEGRRRISERSGIGSGDLDRVHETVALVMHRGLGDDRARQLARLGIHDRAALAPWTAPALAEALRRQGTTPRDRFLERRARIWLTSLP